MHIETSRSADIDLIFSLYAAATDYMCGRGTVRWPVFERGLIETEIREGRQFKMIEDDEIVCVWALAFSDPQIWQSADKEKAVYIHRIATHPEHRGKGFVKKILSWTTDYAKQRNIGFVRLDTVGENQGLIRHYQRSGFTFLGLSKLTDTDGLPAHYHNATVSLFELNVNSISDERTQCLQS